MNMQCNKHAMTCLNDLKNVNSKIITLLQKKWFQRWSRIIFFLLKISKTGSYLGINYCLEFSWESQLCKPNPILPDGYSHAPSHSMGSVCELPSSGLFINVLCGLSLGFGRVSLSQKRDRRVLVFSKAFKRLEKSRRTAIFLYSELLCSTIEVWLIQCCRRQVPPSLALWPDDQF